MPEPDEIQFQCIGCGTMNPAGAAVCVGCGHAFGGPGAAAAPLSSPPRRRAMQEIQGEFRELTSPYDPPQVRRSNGPEPSLGSAILSFLASYLASMMLVLLGLAAIVIALVLALMIALLALCGGGGNNGELVGYMMGTMVVMGLLIGAMVFLIRWLRNRNNPRWEKRR